MPDEPTQRRDFAGFYRATLTPLRRYLARLLGNSTEAQDVAQDAYLRVYPKMEDHSAVNPKAVLYTTARRLAINQIKRRQIGPFSPNEARPDNTAAAQPGVAQEVMARQELRDLEQAIAQLPEGCRTVLLLRKIDLLSHREIAQRLGIAISTVEKQHARALRLLRATLPVDHLSATTPAPTTISLEGQP
jgi:RNA polymerase sigma-70 factor (ECF subfamily)